MRRGSMVWILAIVTVGVAAVAAVWGGSSRGPVDPGCDGEPDGPSALVGFDPGSGAKRWETTVGLVGGAAHLDDLIVTRAEVGVIRAHEIQSGRLRWCVDVDDAKGGSELTRAGDGVAIVVGGEIVGFDADGRERWRAPAPYERSWIFGGDVVWVFDWAAQRADRYVGLDATTGEPIDVAPDPPPRHGLSWYGLDVAPSSLGDLDISWGNIEATGTQELSIAVTDGDHELWRRDDVPGSLAAIAGSADGPVVIVSDPTGDTGDLGAFGNDVLTGYDAADGRRLWSIPVVGPQLMIAPVTDETVVVAVGAELIGLDSATGATQWEADLGSPGQGGSYKWPGRFTFVAATNDAAVGLISAREPTPPGA